MTITLSNAQHAAVKKLKSWFLAPERQPVFRIFGYAGSGKSTIVAHALAELGIGPHLSGADAGFLAATFTGKAALVMSRKGTPASTIHSLIYRVSEATEAEIAQVREQIRAIEAALPALGPGERTLEEARLRSLQLRLTDLHQPRFVLNEQSIVRDAALIVLDEVSMVGEEMARDLLAFGRPILVLGDPGQLPPIKGEGAFTRDPPDVMLTEIHRQAGESAVIRLATMAREGRPIPYGEHDAHVWKLPRAAVTAEQMLRGGQVICGRNATRIQLNLAMKRSAGFDGTYPSGRTQGDLTEKIICLKNRNDLGLVTGMFLRLEDVRDENEVCFSARIRPEDAPAGATQAGDGRYFLYKGHFDDHVAPDPERGRWLYTAITRAERGLVLLD